MTGIGIRPPKKMTFGTALELLKGGYRLRRRGWNGKNQYLEFQPGVGAEDYHKVMVLTIWRPFLYIVVKVKEEGENIPSETRTPWTASQPDMLSDDWEVVDGAEG